MIKAIAVKALQKFILLIKFSDGVEGVVDLSHLKSGEAFKCWQEEGVFERVYIDGNGIAWNENLDIDTMNVYLKITKQTFAEFIRKQQAHA